MASTLDHGEQPALDSGSHSKRVTVFLQQAGPQFSLSTRLNDMSLCPVYDMSCPGVLSSMSCSGVLSGRQPY
ncbi:hypothetical protein RRG08_033299 [Elysia crispata]|uniref:Uncharacterized protein n=1 Tax=Elysia crispata TaxID=231223 RepID=A0AAE0XRB9_9GAST|nr:hypothetical protein RRG08_033299 [Elysia crispata]